MLETISHYNYNSSNVNVLLLDATKAFDRVHYYKLFKLLIDKGMSPLVIRLLIFMYTNQKMGRQVLYDPELAQDLLSSEAQW